MEQREVLLRGEPKLLLVVLPRVDQYWTFACMKQTMYTQEAAALALYLK